MVLLFILPNYCLRIIEGKTKMDLVKGNNLPQINAD